MNPQAALGWWRKPWFSGQSMWPECWLRHSPSTGLSRILTPLSSHFLVSNTGFRVLLSQGEEQMRCHHSYHILALFSFQVFNFCRHGSLVNQSRSYCLCFQVGELRLRKGTWIFPSHIAFSGSARIRKSLPVFLCIIRAPTKPAFA